MNTEHASVPMNQSAPPLTSRTAAKESQPVPHLYPLNADIQVASSQGEVQRIKWILSLEVTLENCVDEEAEV